jgi:hypothetical protein
MDDKKITLPLIERVSATLTCDFEDATISVGRLVPDNPAFRRSHE